MGVTEEEVLLDRKVFLDQKVSIRATKIRGPFLESPENFSGLGSHF